MKRSFDRHLNVFWCYNGKPYLEDNLTRAFITTLSFLDKNKQIEFIKWFIEDEIKMSEIKVSFDLQKPYLDIDTEIKKAKKRIMIGFNPTGECWGSENYDILNKIEKYQFEIEKLNLNNYENYLSKKLSLEVSKLKKVDKFGKTDAEKLKDIILSYLNRGGSRPDAWIFIHRNNVLEIAIAIETKLWDLDPEQLANHCKVCLDIPKEEVKYKTFRETFDKLKKIKDNNMIVYHFLDYMEKIGYYTNIDLITMNDFDRAFALKEEDSKLGEEILNRKLNKYFNSYFKSKEYLELKNKYSLEDDYLDKRWISIKKIGVKGLGNVYFDTYFDNRESRKILFFIGTEIGVAKGWYNKLFSKKLKNEKFKEELSKLYPQRKNEGYQSRFEIFLRVNQCNYSSFIYLKQDKNLNEVLNLKEQIPFQGSLSKVECIEKLRKYIDENNLQLQRIKERGSDKSIATNYNLMSYLRFIDYVKLDYILEVDEREFNIKFSEILEKHLYGLQEINNMIKS